MENTFILSIIVFILTYVIIISEKVDRTVIAMLGASVFLLLGILTQEEAVSHIDFNTIGLLIGMMIIVNIISRTGFFHYLAIKSAKSVGGDPWKIIVIYSIITAISSALLDNVTTILLMVPITLVIVDALETSAVAFVLPLVIMANIGGTATLIGDPPNIMIGSAVGLTFMDFLFNLAPVILVISLVVMLIFKLGYKKQMAQMEDHSEKIMAMDEHLAIKDGKLLRRGLIVLGITIAGFACHGVLGLESATIALVGASVLLFVSGCDPEEVLVDIEWSTLFFFMALFVLVGGLEEAGVIEVLAEKLLLLVQDNIVVGMMAILWGSAIASAFLDNIPFVATMIPLITKMGEMSPMDITPLWWALALGACLGGNGTVVGASANVIATGMLNKHGEKMTFLRFMKVGFPIMILSVGMASFYLIARYA